MSEQSAKERRAKQTVNNLLLSLLATAGLVLLIILVVPRDESNRIPHINYNAVAAQAAASSKLPIIAPELPKGWWANNATWYENPVDAVPRFEAGFVGPNNNTYIGLVEGFDVNPTWSALNLKDVVLEKNYQNSGSLVKWSIYKSAEVHNPPKSRDEIWVATFGNNQILIYGTAAKSSFVAFTQTIEQKLAGK